MEILSGPGALSAAMEKTAFRSPSEKDLSSHVAFSGGRVLPVKKRTKPPGSDSWCTTVCGRIRSCFQSSASDQLLIHWYVMRKFGFGFTAVSKWVEELGITVTVKQPNNSWFLTPFDFFPDYHSWNSSLALILAILLSSGRTPFIFFIIQFLDWRSSSFRIVMLPEVSLFQFFNCSFKFVSLLWSFSPAHLADISSSHQDLTFCLKDLCRSHMFSNLNGLGPSFHIPFPIIRAVIQYEAWKASKGRFRESFLPLNWWKESVYFATCCLCPEIWPSVLCILVRNIN